MSHRKAGQKGTKFLFVSSNLSRLEQVPGLMQWDALNNPVDKV